MNQYESYRLQKKIHYEPTRLVDSFQQYKSITSLTNLPNKAATSTAAWTPTTNDQSINSPTPLFIKSPFKNNSKIQISFLKDNDCLTTSTQNKISLYGSLLKTNNSNTKPNDFISHSHENFTTSSHKIIARTQVDNSLKRYNLHNLQSKPSSAGINNLNSNLKLKITNVTIKQNTIDMREQLSMIPEVGESTYVLNEKAKLLAKLIEKSANLKIESLENLNHNQTVLKSANKKKPCETSIYQLKSLDLNLDLEKNLKLVDDSSDQFINNNFTLSYPSLYSNSCYFSQQKFNTKLDRQFKRVTPNTERNKKNSSILSNTNSRSKSSKAQRDDSSNVIHHYKETRKLNPERTSITSEIKGTSIKLRKTNPNNSDSNNNSNKNNYENSYTASMIDFT